MATTQRVTVTLPAEQVRVIDRFERNRSRFISEAVDREILRRQREGLLASVDQPHPETSSLGDFGVEDWLVERADDEGLVDVDGGVPVRWVDGEGWRRSE